MDYEEGEEGEALLLVEVAVDAGNGLFAFAVGEEGDEGMRGCGAGKGNALAVIGVANGEEIGLTWAGWVP